MYFWIVILFSMVTVMTYKMSSKDDDFNTRTSPAMESSVAGFVQQHNAIRDYIKEKQTYTFTLEDEQVPFATFQQYLPYGYKQNNKYKSIILCIDQDDGSKARDCNDTTSVNFLLTYTDLPSKWQDAQTRAFFLASLGRYTSRTDEIGVVDPVTATPTEGPIRGDQVFYAINSVQGSNVYLPQMFRCVDTVTDPSGMLMYLTQLRGAYDETMFVRTATGYCDLDITDNVDAPPSNEEEAIKAACIASGWNAADQLKCDGKYNGKGDFDVDNPVVQCAMNLWGVDAIDDICGYDPVGAICEGGNFEDDVMGCYNP